MARSLAAAVLLLFCGAAAGAETARHHLSTNHGVNRQREVNLAPTRVLVEFAKPANRELFQRFRGDLANIERRAPVTNSTRRPMRVDVRHEYSIVYSGAAITASRATIESIRALPYVRAVNPDRLMYATVVETDFGMHAGQRVNAGSLATRGKGVTVAVIDTGIDYNHPALGRGFGPGFKVAGGYDFVSDDNDPLDDRGHGTHVAAIIAGDGSGLTGVAPEATLISYKVLDSNGSGSTSDVIAAIERAVDPNGDGNPADHVDVINLSLGSPGHPDDEASLAVDKAVDAGVIVVAAAGNDGRAMSIGSPAAARKAITVGAYDEYDQVAFFSSKGPTSKAYTFKPDMVAPGNMIISAKMGGGTVEMSGTSMAAPHVAGAAALLKALHPDWTPSDVKAALASSAQPLLRESDPLAMGAGKIDVAAATAVTLFTSEAGISFGLNTSSTGQWSQTRTIRVTNRSAGTETLSVTVPPSPDGMTVTVSPMQLTIPSGQSGDITLSATADNAKLEHPFSLSIYSSIRIGAAIGVNLPWALIRASRAVVTYDKPFTGGESIELFNMSNSTQLFPIDAHTAEAILQPGKYDLVMQTYEGWNDDDYPTAMRLIVAENLDVQGEKTIAMTQASAPHHFRMNALDDQGRPLASFERIPDRREHVSVVRLSFIREEADAMMDASYFFSTPTVTDVYVSTLSNAFTVGLSQAYLDADNHRGYTVAHPVSRGVTAGATLTSDPSKYLHAMVRANHPDDAGLRQTLGSCLAVNDTRQFGTLAISAWCVMNEANANGSFDVWTMPDTTQDAHIALQVATYLTRTPPLRAIGGTIIATAERTPSARDLRIANHGQLTIGLGPFYPMVAFGTAGRQGMDYHHGGVLGPAGEIHDHATYNALFTMWDAGGKVVAGGVSDRYELPPEPQLGYRFKSLSERLMSRARSSTGTVEVQFGTSADDLIAPLITSLSVRNAAGTVVDRLTRGETASLVFSGGDYDLGGFPRMAAGGSSPGATKAWWRVSGTSAWTPLAVTITGSETERRSETGHWPAGDLYKADFSAATAVDNALVDLRIELADPAGNRLTWTHERAIMIGTVSAPGNPKRRSLR